jgi:transcriptional regulator with XRE-family HTH domain
VNTSSEDTLASLLSQFPTERLAASVGVTKGTASRWQHGHTIPGTHLVLPLAVYTGIDSRELSRARLAALGARKTEKAAGAVTR